MMEEKTCFRLDPSKCIGCGKCVNVCSGMVLELRDGRPVMKPFERFGWGVQKERKRKMHRYSEGD